MANKIDKKDPSTIEKIVCHNFLNEIRPMTKKETEIFIKLELAGVKMGIDDDMKPLPWKILESWIESQFTYKIVDERVYLFISLLAQTPGKVILYGWYLQYWSNKNNKKEIDWRTFIEIFPMGFPTDAHLDNIWSDQKVSRDEGEFCGTDNLVDYFNAGFSMYTEEELQNFK